MSTLLDVVIEACSEKICSSIAQRTFQKYYPRLMVRNNVPSDWEDGEQAMSNTLVLITSMRLVSPCSALLTRRKHVEL